AIRDERPYDGLVAPSPGKDRVPPGLGEMAPFSLEHGRLPGIRRQHTDVRADHCRESTTRVACRGSSERIVGRSLECARRTLDDRPQHVLLPGDVAAPAA